MTKTDARVLFVQAFGMLTLHAAQHKTRFIVTCFGRTAVEQQSLVDRRLSRVAHSQHQDWLAIDIAILDDRNRAVWAHEFGDSYDDLGAFWAELHPLCRWGGTFGRTERKPGWDPYHFEISSAYKRSVDSSLTGIAV